MLHWLFYTITDRIFGPPWGPGPGVITPPTPPPPLSTLMPNTDIRLSTEYRILISGWQPNINYSANNIRFNQIYQYSVSTLIQIYLIKLKWKLNILILFCTYNTILLPKKHTPIPSVRFF